MADPKPVSVLFVCLGNICRSTMAEGVFQSLVAARPPTATPAISHIDSAGTINYHAGKPPDQRTLDVLRKNGITSYTHAARQVQPDDFSAFDYIFAMDAENLSDLQSMRSGLLRTTKKGEDELGQVLLFGRFGGRSVNEEVVDPYYGVKNGFEVAFEQMQRLSRGFLEYLEGGAKI